MRSLIIAAVAATILVCCPAQFTFAQAKTTFVVGVRCEKGKSGRGLLIKGVLEGSAADKAGLSSGQWILKVNDDPAVDSSQIQSAAQAAGGNNQVLTLTILDPPDQQRTVKLKPAARRQPSVFDLFSDDSKLAENLFKSLEGVGQDSLDFGEFQFGKPPRESSANDPITISGRINLGQLIGNLFGLQRPTDPAAVSRLETKVDALNAKLDRLIELLERAHPQAKDDQSASSK